MRWVGGLLTALAVACSVTWLVWRWHWKTVKARVWRPSSPGFVFPEMEPNSKLGKYLESKDDFGIALAGGGERGFALAHGVVRALREAGILERARYLSTTSGSILLSLPMYYQTQDSLENFLGSSLPPQDLSDEVLTSPITGSAIQNLTYLPKKPKKQSDADQTVSSDQPPSSLRGAGSAFQTFDEEGSPHEMFDWLSRWRRCLSERGWCSCLVDMAMPDGSMHDVWDILLGKLFLEPFGLAKRWSWQCHESEVAEVSEQLGKDATIFTARDISQNLPFSIFQTDIIAPYTGRENKSLVTFPLEHTPLYTGTAPGYSGSSAAPYHGVGDVLVSSFAWPSVPLESIASDSGWSNLRLQPDLLNYGSLTKVASLATSFMSDWQSLPVSANYSTCHIAGMEKLLPDATLWSPLHTDENGVPVASRVPVGDPGLSDDLGHIPLLRRGVRKMLVYDSAAIHDNVTGHEAVNLCEMTYMMAAFGVAGCLSPPNKPGASDWNMKENYMRVFDPADFGPFWDTIKAHLELGEPAVYKGKLTVVDNPYLGIKGGWEVEVVWVTLLPSQSWRSALPGTVAPFVSDFFPNVKVTDFQSRMMMAVMSQFASWFTTSKVAEAVQALLGRGHNDLSTASQISTVDV